MILQFVGGADLGARLIEWYDHGPYSHVDAVLADGRLLGARSDTIGGAPPGVHIRTPDYEAWTTVKRVELAADGSMEVAFLNRLYSQMGKPYDMQAIAGFVVGRDWRASGSWFCSELQCWALEEAGWFPWALSTPTNKVAPSDLLLAISARARVA